MLSKHLDDALCKDFPLFFRRRSESPRITCMGRGFTIGDGWEPLVRQAAELIEPLIAEQLRCGIPVDDTTCAAQVKEKFGRLTIYTDSGTDDIDKILSSVGLKSTKTCDVCGQPGSLVVRGAYMTRCVIHAPEGAVTPEEFKALWQEKRANKSNLPDDECQ